MKRPLPLPATLLLGALCSCAQPPEVVDDPPAARPNVHSEAQAEYAASYGATPLQLSGSVRDPAGGGIAGALVEIGALVATTDTEGGFVIEGQPRRNGLLRVSADGFRPAVVPVVLALPLSVTAEAVPAVVLTPESPDTVRFLFGGDTSFGRRFVDPDETTPRDEVPPDDPEAWVLASDPGPGSVEVVSMIEPLFATADFRVLNLETPVTEDPSTPHPEKDFAFFTLPGSLDALHSLGVQNVSLGNNHTFDYLESGLVDTLDHLDAAGIGWSGAGVDSEQALEAWRVDLAGSEYSLLSATSVAGDRYDIDYVASETKGGAADLRDTDGWSAAIEREIAAGRLPIALLHTG